MLPHRRRLRVEPLEDRRLFSITVSTLVDEADGSIVDGDISLRDAIAAAPSGETIDFAPALTAGGPATILLTQGELVINKNLTINGLGTDLLTIDASGNDPTPDVNNGDGSRIFNIDDGNFTAGKTVSISGLTLSGGDVTGRGGAISNNEKLTVMRTTISGNSATGGGGGIGSSFFGGGANISFGDLTVTDSTISGNSAAGDSGFPRGGGISMYHGDLTVTSTTINNNSAAQGGGISKTGNGIGDVAIADCTISGNSARYEGGGIYVGRYGANFTISNSTISDNSCGSTGGGGIFASNVWITVTDTTISGNFSGGHGGAILKTGWGDLTVTGSTIRGNDAGNFGGGMLMSSSSASLTVNSTTISENSAQYGGGIYHSVVNALVDSCLINDNSASVSGGGIRGGNLTVAGSMISGNSTVGDGGGIDSFGRLTITGSTIMGNSASDDGGGIFFRKFSTNAVFAISGCTISGNTADSSGGGVSIYSKYSSGTFGATVNYTTISGNSAEDGGGIGVGGVEGTTIDLSHTIVAGNTRGVSATPDDVTGSVTAAFSLLGVNTGTAITDNGGNLIGTAAAPIDPLLGPLAANGGPTKTHALFAGSPAIDAGDPVAVAGVGTVPLVDQRGTPFGRVKDGDGVGGTRIDIGAFEVQPVGPTLPGDYNQNNVVDTADYVLWRKTLGMTGVPAFSGADGNGDTTIDQDDYGVWRANFGMTVPAPGAGSAAGVPTLSAPAIQIREPAELLPTETTAAPAETDLTAARAAGFAPLDNPSHWQDSGSRSRGRIQRYKFAESGSKDLLLLAIDRVEHASPQDVAAVDYREMDDLYAHDWESQWLIDESPTTALAEWRSAWGDTGVVRR